MPNSHRMVPAAPAMVGIACEEVPGHPDFVGLGDIDGIAVDLRYASHNNFFGKDLYAFLDCAWLHQDAARALQAAATALKAVRPDLQLLVLDAMRPQRVQQMLWDVLHGTNLRQYVGSPERGSVHSFGMAVDITLADADGQEFDMGSHFDEMSERSHPDLETQLLAQGVLTNEHVGRRDLLRSVMFHAGFGGISNEWWHFDCGSPQDIRSRYQRIL